VLDRSWHTDAHSSHVADRSVDRREELEADRGDAVQDLVRPVCDVARDHLLAEDSAREVCDRNAGMGRAEVDRQHDPIVAIERETRRRTTTGRGGFADRRQQA
jgi:hypothetical protein